MRYYCINITKTVIFHIKMNDGEDTIAQENNM